VTSYPTNDCVGVFMNPHAFFSERNNSQDADSDSDDHVQSPSVDVLWALDAVLAAVPNVKSAAVVPCPILPSADSLFERHRNHLKFTEKIVVIRTCPSWHG
jgi:hypothetical protein